MLFMRELLSSPALITSRKANHMGVKRLFFVYFFSSLESPEKFTETPVSGKKFQHIMDLTYGSNFLQFPYRK